MYLVLIMAGTIQSLSAHYRYRNPHGYGNYAPRSISSHLTFIQLSKRLKHHEFDLNDVELNTL